MLIQTKVDFINAHLGMGFPIPLVMLNQANILSGDEIGRIICNFCMYLLKKHDLPADKIVVTNILSWTIIFAVSYAFLILATGLRLRPIVKSRHSTATSHLNEPRTRVGERWQCDSTSISDQAPNSRIETTQYATTPSEVESRQAIDAKSSIGQGSSNSIDTSAWWRFCAANFPILASSFGIAMIGVPLAACTREERILDGCVLWFVWISSVRLQKGFKTSRPFVSAPSLKNALATLMNPVLATTLIVTAFTRIKAAVVTGLSLSQVLQDLSSGIPLYSLWTSAATETPLPHGATPWFGAGDAALSILDCGILIWGFKLYECRRQLFCTAGLLTMVASVAAAIANVFLCVLLGRAMGLYQAEALAFAARSTTLALAKPAMEAVGGNIGANAALVVSNGILGQLMYPFLLDRSKVKIQGDAVCLDMESSDVSILEPSSETLNRHVPTASCCHQDSGGDDPMTIAAGIAIGVNGAAMGVAYLYETKSRAAPYATLAMTVFGVMTVILTTVEPFKNMVLSLAGH